MTSHNLALSFSPPAPSMLTLPCALALHCLFPAGSFNAYAALCPPYLFPAGSFNANTTLLTLAPSMLRGCMRAPVGLPHISIGGRVFRKTSIYVISGRHQHTSCPSDKIFLKGVAVVLNMRTALTERLQFCIAAIV